MSGKKSAIDTDLIRQLAELLKAGDLSEIEIEEDDLRIRLAREIAPVAVNAPVYAAPAPAAPAREAAPSTGGASGQAPGGPQEPAAAESEGSQGTPVPSPMVGTAYHSPAPGAEPFIREGQKVSKGQTIMIIEAMKTMNQIPAPADGTVRKICVEDGQPVEYGESLVLMG